MSVVFTDLKRSFELHQQEYEEAALSALRSGWYVLGDSLKEFEDRFAAFFEIEHCIGVGCGQDALILAVRALGISEGDEVIVAGNTYIATVLAVTENGATPVFVDCNEWFEIDEGLIENAVTDQTKAVLLTNLYGQCANLLAIRKICNANNLSLIEDCAQSHGASFGDKIGGTVGDIACFSFYPTKPLGAFGDGGAILCHDGDLASRIRMLRNYGSRKKYVNEENGGINSRLDEIQAAMLLVGLNHLNESNRERIAIAERYLREIDNPHVKLPKIRENANHVFHIFAVLSDCRDELQRHLDSQGISTQIHYPIPPYRAECYAKEDFFGISLACTDHLVSQQLSLPIYAGMPKEDVDQVISGVNSFLKDKS